MNPAELFWVTKHGIKMTGMPAWGATHDDEALWPVVALMTELPHLDAARYRALLASAGDMGHHEVGNDDGHGDDNPDVDDHSTHPHDPTESGNTKESDHDH